MPKVKMPTAFNVFGQIVTIDYHSDVIHLENGNQVAGLYHIDEKHIDISAHKNKDELFRTFYHELSHALMDRLGLRQTMISHDVHEIICEGFSRFIHENFVLRKEPLKTKQPRKKPKKASA